MTIPEPAIDVAHVPPMSSDGATPLELVPVIRVFGTTPMGQNVCLHIHQVFPYFFVPYYGPTEPNLCKRYCKQLHASLNQALDIALKQQHQKQEPSAQYQHVLQVELVRGNPLYGFHQTDQLFLKIYMVHPLRLKKAAMLLQSGAIMNTVMQPHESHIPYLLQFFIDYNIFGMDYIDLDQVVFRPHVPDDVDATKYVRTDILDVRGSPMSPLKLPRSLHALGKENTTLYNASSIPASAIWPATSVLASRESYCELEVDTVASAIVNRHHVQISEVPARGGPIAETAKHNDQKLVRSLSNIWEDERRRRIKQRRSPTFTPEISQDRKEATSVHGLHRVDHVYRELLEHDGSVPPTDGTGQPRSATLAPTAPKAANPIGEHPPGATPAILAKDGPVSRLVETTIDDLVAAEGGAWDDDDHDEDGNIGDDMATIRAWQQLLAARRLQQQETNAGKSSPQASQFAMAQATAVVPRGALNERLAQDPLWSQTVPNLTQPSPSPSTPHKPDVVLSSPNHAPSDWPGGFVAPLRFLDTPSASQQLVLPPPSPQQATTAPKLSDDITVQVDEQLVLATQIEADQSTNVDHSLWDEMEMEAQSVLAQFYENRVEPNSAVPTSSQATDDTSQILHWEASGRQPRSISTPTTKTKRTPTDPGRTSTDDMYDIPDTVLRNIISPQLDTPHRNSHGSVASNDYLAENDVDIATMLADLQQADEIAAQLDHPTLRDEFWSQPNFGEGNDVAKLSRIQGSRRTSQRDLALLKPLSQRLDTTFDFRDERTASSSQYATSTPVTTPFKMTEQPRLSRAQYDGAGDETPRAKRTRMSSTDTPSSPRIPKRPSNKAADVEARIEDYERRHWRPSPSVQRRIDLCRLGQWQTDSLLLPESSTSRPTSITLIKTVPVEASNETPLSPVPNASVLRYNARPPVLADLLRTARDTCFIAAAKYQEPYFSNPSDIPARPRSFAGREYEFKAQTIATLLDFDLDAVVAGTSPPITYPSLQIPTTSRSLLYLPPPPRLVVPASKTFGGVNGGSEGGRISGPLIQPAEVDGVDDPAEPEKDPSPSSPTGPSFVINLPMVTSTPRPSPVKKSNTTLSQRLPPARSRPTGAHAPDAAQIEGPTPRNPHGFKISPVSSSTTAAAHEMLFQKQHLRILALEDDRLAAHSPELTSSTAYQPGFYPGVIVVDPTVISDESCRRATPFATMRGCQTTLVATEVDLFKRVIDLVRKSDPDVLVGYEIQQNSWGYLIDRAPRVGENAFATELSRVMPAFVVGVDGFETDQDSYHFRQNSGLSITGRIVLNLWRILRTDLPLNVYSFENVVFHVLHQRIPYVMTATILQWWTGGHSSRWRAMRYMLDRVQKDLQLIEELDIIGRTSEFARVFGIDFSSVISRGSQYRVESMMLRLGKQENFVPVTPSKRQVENQRAPESIPLVMEPQSRFYTSPVVVLDFQSLYPSIMIAYNYCFSTCLGRVAASTDATGTKKFGTCSLTIPPGMLSSIKDEIRVSPNGVMFVTTAVRKGVLPRMLTEILDTRVMIKKSLKHNKNNKILARILDARQLGLKLIANVTYGYTSASFSGRMPCAEVADAIVQTARETLERSIRTIEDEFPGSKVVYGDTDSLFVHLPGATRSEAFRVGRAIADRITALNPKPMKLKFEKVYHPCVLLTKKRYVGFMYESPEDKEPTFDAKGIETVRRDTCPAVSKMLERTIKILFRSRDLSEIKVYLQRQWTKILTGRVSVQDFIFSKEVRLGTYSSNGTLPPSALVATHRMSTDPRAQPRFGERVRYVVVYGGPQARLMDLVVSPEQLLNDKSLRLHATYYITKQIIPAIGRVLNLVGADLMSWFTELPRVYRVAVRPTEQVDPPLHVQPVPVHARRTGAGATSNLRGVKTIDSFYKSSHCMLCHAPTNEVLCAGCRANPQQSTLTGLTLVADAQRGFALISRICFDCIGSMEQPVACVSLDCPIYFERLKSQQNLERLDLLSEALRELRN